jgi:hypothetical protein
MLAEVVEMQTQTIRSQRLTQILLATLAIGVWGLLLRMSLPIRTAGAEVSRPQSDTTFATLTAQRINIVDPDGTTRLVISNSALFPEAKVRGRTYKRSVHGPAGMVFYNANGTETGGIVLSKINGNDQTALVWDYTHQPTDGIAIGKFETANRWQAGLSINDRRPYHPGPIHSSQGVERVWLGDQNQDAQLVLSDAQGHARIRIGVDHAGTPVIEMLNATGQVTYRAGASH